MPQAIEEMPATEIRVQPATPDDLDWIVDQLAAFTRWVGTKHTLHASGDFWRKGLGTMIESHVFLIARKGDLRVGLIAGTLGPHPFNPDLILLCESFWWVDPAYRDGRAGLALLDEFIRVGRERADWITMALEAQSPVNERVVTKRGFRHFETSYLMEVE